MSIEKILVERFEVLEYNGTIGISMPLKEEPCQTGEFIYDGRNCAILIRNEDKAFIFTNIAPEAREKLIQAPKIMMVETEGEEVTNSYMVDVTKVDEVPYEDTLPETIKEMLHDIKEVYGEEGVRKIAETFWGIK